MYWYDSFADAADAADFVDMEALESLVLADGIYRSRQLYSENQVQTQGAFAFKWDNRSSYESPSFKQAGKNGVVIAA